MKYVMTALALALAIVPAHAISRYNSESIDCADAQSRVKREGAVIFRYKSKRNPSLTRYDRYVLHRGYCAFNEYAANAWVPTRDRAECFVRNCKPISYREFRF